MPSQKPGNPSFADIAEAANVSLATVDRVVNRRPGVKDRTIDRVLSVAVELGYMSDAERRRLASPRAPNVAFLLPMGGNPYLRLLGDKVRAAAGRHKGERSSVRCFFIESFDAQALAAALRHHARWAEGIAFMAIDHPLVREAAEEVALSGTRLVTIVSDLPHSARETYLGLDNQAAGRTAAYLLGRFCGTLAGSLALVAGSRTYRTHSEREAGFLGLVEEAYPDLRVLGMREGHDDRNENYHHTLSLIEQNPDLIGIYNVGGASDGIARALRETGHASRIVFIGHGLTADTRRFLIEGTMDAVINSDPDQMIARTLAHFSAASVTSTAAMKMDVVFRENIPANFV